MHVVFGANGRAGGETARALLERGESVRVVLRRREQARNGPPWVRMWPWRISSMLDAVVAALSGASGSVRAQSHSCQQRSTHMPTKSARHLRMASACATPKVVVLSSIARAASQGHRRRCHAQPDLRRCSTVPRRQSPSCDAAISSRRGARSRVRR